MQDAAGTLVGAVADQVWDGELPLREGDDGGESVSARQRGGAERSEADRRALMQAAVAAAAAVAESSVLFFSFFFHAVCA